MKTPLVLPDSPVEITQREYDELIKDSEFLQCLRDCGVDNWDGYDEAQQLMRGNNQTT